MKTSLVKKRAKKGASLKGGSSGRSDGTSAPSRRDIDPPGSLLRARAEARILRGPKKSRALPRNEADAQRLLHELRVHQTELELQNEALVSARGQTESALERYTELFDFAPVGYVVLGADETILEVNESGQRILGADRGRLQGKSFLSFVATPDRAAFGSLLGRALDSSARERFEATLQTRAGAITALITVRAPAHGARRFLIAFEDISERKEREDRLRRAEAVLRESDRRKDDFLAVLSHELRNPLAPIKSGLFVLSREAPGSPKAMRAHEVIDRQVSHMTRLIDDLLDVTRIARAQVQLRREIVDLAPLVRGTLEDHASGFESSGVQLSSEIEPGASWVDGDPARLVQIVANLLGNAKKFTPPGGRVCVVLKRDGQGLELRVRDTGVGIADGYIDRVFEPFVQAPQPMDRKRGGLGLGLAMVKGLVELHDGTVGITSAGLGRGTEVTLRLPLRDAPAAREPAPAPRPACSRRVLIVEDNEDAADTLQAALSLGSHQVRVAYDGLAGLDLARAFDPEIVICDIGLPGMDGFDVARAIRSDDKLRGTYLVALSGYAQLEDRRRAMAAGFNQHLAKPPSLEALDRVIAEAPEKPSELPQG